MKIENVHSSVYPVSTSELGWVLDTLSSNNDLIWPTELWPAMKFKNGLVIGSSGGHSPIRYSVEKYIPEKLVVFRFLSPSGFEGTHSFEVESRGDKEAQLTHRIAMNAVGTAKFSWPVIIRPLHDALLEDCLAKVSVSLGLEPKKLEWSNWVKFLRWSMSGGRARDKSL